MTALSAITNPAIIGTVSYGSYTFPAVRKITTSVKPHYDATGRSVSYNVHTFVVQAFLNAANEGAQSTTMDSIYSILSKPGQRLVVDGVGLGNIDVAVGKDVNWGPKPQITGIFPTAGYIAAEIEWTVEVALPVCGDSADRNGLSEFSYAIDYAIDEGGTTTRTISGHAMIAQSRAAGGQVTRTADQFREAILSRFPLPLGFARSQNWTDGANRSQLNFTITDRQLAQDDSFPRGIKNADLTFSMQLQRSSLATIQTELSGTLEHVEGFPRDWGWQVFYLIASSTLQGLVASNPGRSILLDRFRFSRSLFSRRSSFSISFRIIGKDPMSLMGDSRMWGPVPGSDFQQWRASMASVWGARGSAGLNNPMPGGDVIVSMCDGDLSGVGTPGTVRTLQSGGPSSGNRLRSIVNPQSSYLHFQNLVTPERRQSYSYQKPSQVWNPPVRQLTAGPRELVATSKPKLPPQQGARRQVDDTIQYQGAPTETITLEGSSLRVGFEPVIPSLSGWGTARPVEVSAKVTVTPLTKMGDQTVYGARWHIVYAVPAGIPDNSIPMPQNPVVDQDQA